MYKNRPLFHMEYKLFSTIQKDISQVNEYFKSNRVYKPLTIEKLKNARDNIETLIRTIENDSWIHLDEENFRSIKDKLGS